jgi:murein DD-endopeptidase MepM/ murein hydrolase activator NlpD
MRKADRSKRSCLGGLFMVLVVAVLVVGYLFYRGYTGNAGRMAKVISWLRDPVGHKDWTITAGQRCGQAPFILPTDGFIGFLWDDSFRPGHRHQGIDIFSGTPVGETPVVAAYAGYLTRLPDWKSSVIIRIPDDPLYPGRQIWTYYTHMADPAGQSFVAYDFPAGTNDVYVEAGTLLGYQGNYSGNPGNPVGVHLHFSIVLDDGQGSFRNELEIQNTLDPSPYLGLPLNAKVNQEQVPVCEEGQ